MKKIFSYCLLLAVGMIVISSCGKRYDYRTVPSDPMSTRIYTLDNGLKVYMSVNKDEPRIQADIAVRVGAKNDPSETTGLAHYFEHLMFKGTEQFGTQNYKAEKPLLDRIETEFENYRKLTGTAERQAAYHIIDSLSYEASKYAIPNEYDKLMAAIGATGTNAYTGYDMTVYVENIPSNQVKAWAKVQADRFKHNVIRGFHTELETVYEEKNMSLTNDARKVTNAILASLFPHHPYGLQSVLGTQEHLKNPSITNIKNYYKKWYVPNNMAICLSGDFNPDEMIKIIDKYFGDMVPNNDLEKLDFKQEDPVKEPIIKTVYGKESPSVSLAWRFPGVSWDKMPLLTIVSDLLYNGSAGLFDININQAQRALFAFVGPYQQADYTAFIAQGKPKGGQTLKQVKDIMLEQVGKLRSGDFDEDAITASINNYKKRHIIMLESNDERASLMVESFINGTNWGDEVSFLDRMSKYTKEDVVKFANEYFADNYVEVEKLEGTDPDEVKIDKPKITPILTNRDTASGFLKSIQRMAASAVPVEPVFLDYNTDLLKLKVKSGIELLYKNNTSNDLFELVFVVDMGSNDNRLISTAVDYFSYLGTSEKSAERILKELYDIACDVNLRSTSRRTYLTISGLSENMETALEIIEDKLAGVKSDESVLANLKSDINVARGNAKLNQRACFQALGRYVRYGPDYVNNILSAGELKKLTSAQLLDQVKKLFNKKHYILYYGPKTKDEVIIAVNKLHNVPKQFEPVAVNENLKMQPTPDNHVYIAPYDAKQIYMLSYSNYGEKFSPEKMAVIRLYNEYFGGGMNSIVFQEMREARGLAYSASAYYQEPGVLKDPCSVNTFIATQNDKMMDAITAFDEIINNMPVSQRALDIAKDNILANIRTNRILRSDVLWAYVNARELGMDTDFRKNIFEKVQNYTLDDVEKFQKETIKNRTYSIGILGDEKDLDMNSLESGKYGTVTRLSKKDIFGY